MIALLRHFLTLLCLEFVEHFESEDSVFSLVLGKVSIISQTLTFPCYRYHFLMDTQLIRLDLLVLRLSVSLVLSVLVL